MLSPDLVFQPKEWIPAKKKKEVLDSLAFGWFIMTQSTLMSSEKAANVPPRPEPSDDAEHCELTDTKFTTSDIFHKKTDVFYSSQRHLGKEWWSRTGLGHGEGCEVSFFIIIIIGLISGSVFQTMKLRFNILPFEYIRQTSLLIAFPLNICLREMWT